MAEAAVGVVQPLFPEPREDEYREVAWGLTEATGKFQPMWINRPTVQGGAGANSGYQVRFELLFCGVCHSDIHGECA